MPYTTVTVSDTDYHDPRERREVLRRAQIRVLKSMGFYSVDRDIYERVTDPKYPDPFVCIGWDTLIGWGTWESEYQVRNDERILKVTLQGEIIESVI